MARRPNGCCPSISRDPDRSRRESVDDSFAAATDFFARYFPDYPTRDFYCQSWLLDPQLATLLPDSNLAAFQRRWTPVRGHPAR